MSKASEEFPEMADLVAARRVWNFPGARRTIEAQAHTSVVLEGRERPVALQVFGNRVCFQFEDDLQDHNFAKVFALTKPPGATLEDDLRWQDAPEELCLFFAREWKARRFGRHLLLKWFHGPLALIYGVLLERTGRARVREWWDDRRGFLWDFDWSALPAPPWDVATFCSLPIEGSGWAKSKAQPLRQRAERSKMAARHHKFLWALGHQPPLYLEGSSDQLVSWARPLFYAQPSLLRENKDWQVVIINEYFNHHAQVLLASLQSFGPNAGGRLDYPTLSPNVSAIGSLMARSNRATGMMAMSTNVLMYGVDVNTPRNDWMLMLKHQIAPISTPSEHERLESTLWLRDWLQAHVPAEFRDALLNPDTTEEGLTDFWAWFRAAS